MLRHCPQFTLPVGCFAVMACIATGSSSAAGEKPLRVFVLAGQSNMEGHARIETFDYIGDDPATTALLKEMRGSDGRPRVCDNVWISYLTGRRDQNSEGFGKLTAGYGARSNPAQDGGKIGPEFTFGITMDKALDEPILIIKTAWGGKSLFHDFRPPSAGPYERTEKDIERNRYTADTSGHYYRLMINHVGNVLKNIKRVYPDYNVQSGYRLSGFIWFQGWNDMVNRDVYPLLPKGSKQNRFANYSRWMADFIRDVRKDLQAPKMPFVIGVMGVGGMQANEGNLEFRKAMAAPASYPEFKDNVTAVQTMPFWDEALARIDAKRGQVRQMGHFLRTKHKKHANKDGSMSKEQQREYLKKYEAELISAEEAALRERGASNAGYHYLGCAKTFALMGKAFAEAMSALLK